MSKVITAFGRRLAIILMNLLVILVSIPTFFTDAYWVLVVQRLALGFFTAVIVNGSSLYISETYPTEIQTSFGVVLNLGIVSGILTMSLVGLALPEKDDVQGCKDDELWRICYGLQIAPAVISTLMWLVWLRNEPL